MCALPNRLQIQTRPANKATEEAAYTPQHALKESINDLLGELTTLRNSFISELARVEEQRPI
jgi:hypothetical protein